MEQQKEEVKVEPKLTMVEEAKNVAARIEAANKVTLELVERQEKAAAMMALGGVADAGIQKQEPKVETPSEYTKRVMSGKI